MGLPPVSQTWTFSLNNVYTFVSVIGGTGSYMFELAGVGGFLPSTMGYTVKGSSNGTTGAMDGTNRITSAANWGTRANSSTSPISWIVLTDGAGIDWCWAFNSASDDIVRLSFSPGGNYVAAATPTNQPTATDEVFNLATGSWTDAGDSGHNRIWNFFGSSDKKMFRSVVFCNSACISFIKGEKLTSALVSPATFTLAVGGGTQGAVTSYYSGAAWSSTVNTTSNATVSTDITKVHCMGADTLILATIGGETPGGGVGNIAGTGFIGFNAELPALQGGTGELMFPTQMGSQTVNGDGKLGTVFDQWYVITNSQTVPPNGDTYGTLQFIAVKNGGGVIVPWDGATTPQIT